MLIALEYTVGNLMLSIIQTMQICLAVFLPMVMCCNFAHLMVWTVASCSSASSLANMCLVFLMPLWPPPWCPQVHLIPCSKLRAIWKKGKNRWSLKIIQVFKPDCSACPRTRLCNFLLTFSIEVNLTIFAGRRSSLRRVFFH
jgi:hypothetical protein